MLRKALSSVYAATVCLVYTCMLATSDGGNFKYLTYWSLCAHALTHGVLFALVVSDAQDRNTNRSQSDRFIYAIAPVMCVLSFTVFLTINVLYYHYAERLLDDEDLDTKDAGKLKLGDFGVHTLPVIVSIMTYATHYPQAQDAYEDLRIPYEMELQRTYIHFLWMYTLSTIYSAVYSAHEVYNTPDVPSNGAYFVSGIASAAVVHLMHFAFTC
ncbi:hypothetical protein CYMTET_38356 [Cymbomonas tetramitiformis]|uniref:Uncharacterized protein n=1 Tax=Cymbomonas tetramitiformis TaxID=36881 RepID=A0AAE0F5R4_9CHLO|nr:hypothetical protein CYMTET_38356 [Cymbomonas tetramitiformis]